MSCLLCTVPVVLSLQKQILFYYLSSRKWMNELLHVFFFFNWCCFYIKVVTHLHLIKILFETTFLEYKLSFINCSWLELKNQCTYDGPLWEHAGVNGGVVNSTFFVFFFLRWGKFTQLGQFGLFRQNRYLIQINRNNDCTVTLFVIYNQPYKYIFEQ